MYIWIERGECEVEVCPSMFMNFWQNEPCETCITSQIFLGRATLTTKPSIEELAATFTFSHHPTSTTQLWLHISNLLEDFATEPPLSCHGRCPALSVGEGEKRKCDQDFRQWVERSKGRIQPAGDSAVQDQTGDSSHWQAVALWEWGESSGGSCWLSNGSNQWWEGALYAPLCVVSWRMFRCIIIISTGAGSEKVIVSVWCSWGDIV